MNSSPLGTILNLLSTISFSNLVNEIHDEQDVKDKDEEGGLFHFSCLDFDFFLSFLLGRFTISGHDDGEFLFLFFDLRGISFLLVKEVCGFSDTLFASLS